jgi:hypothetical protein
MLELYHDGGSSTFLMISLWLVCRYLKLNPRDKKSSNDEEYISLQLELASSSVKPNTVVDASFKLLIYDQSHGKHSKHLGKMAN